MLQQTPVSLPLILAVSATPYIIFLFHTLHIILCCVGLCVRQYFYGYGRGVGIKKRRDVSQKQLLYSLRERRQHRDTALTIKRHISNRGWDKWEHYMSLLQSRSIKKVLCRVIQIALQHDMIYIFKIYREQPPFSMQTCVCMCVCSF